MSNNRFNPLAHTNTVLAYVFGKRKDEIFQTFQTLLQPTTLLDFIPITGGGAYQYPDKHEISKCNTQKIERKKLNFRTWIKRLNRKTLCFSKRMIPSLAYSSTRSSLGLIFLPNYRFNPLQHKYDFYLTGDRNRVFEKYADTLCSVTLKFHPTRR